MNYFFDVKHYYYCKECCWIKSGYILDKCGIYQEDIDKLNKYEKEVIQK
jgi:hypothetical protein